jgi:hypothetical protein
LPKLSDLTGKPRQRGKRWAKGIGIEIGNQKYSGWWDDRSLYIKNTDELSLVITPQGCQTVRDAGIPSKAERPRKKGLFEGPKVLVSQGSKDMKVAFCNFLVLFQNSLYAIASKARDANLLRFLSAVIKSDLAQYFLFHTSANWGIEREKVVFHELLSLPFFLPPDAPDQKKAEDIIAEVATVIEDFEAHINQAAWLGHEDTRKDEADRVSREVLEPLVREYYDIDKYEKMLIEDTLQFAAKSFHPRQNTPDVPTLRTPTTKDAETYTQTLCEMLNNFGRDTNFRVQGDVVMAIPYSIVNLRLSSGATRTVVVSDAPGKLKAIFERMQPLLEHQQGRFVFCRNLKVFDGDDLYILKPMQMRFWSRTAALNDADEIAGAMLQHRRPR